MSNTGTYRLSALDVLRGFIIVLMALDHVRDFFGPTSFRPEDLSQTNPTLFLTRWFTHFCAPVFMFLAGTSAWLYGDKVKDKRSLSRFLLTRGIWLIVLDLVVINLSMMFDWPWNKGFLLAIVLWAIGLSMIVLAALVHLSMRWILGIAILLIAGHNLLDGVQPEMLGSWGWLWKVLHIGGSFILLSAQPPFGLVIAYPLIPWVGVMALGYAFGPVMRWEARRRQRLLLQVGIGTIVFFVALRATNWYGDPSDWAQQERGGIYSLFSFINTSKYPPSLLYLCMTLGPAALLLLLFERWKGIIPSFFQTFGQVPLFFFLVHFPLAHILSRSYYGWNSDMLFNVQAVTGYSYDLKTVYIAWILVIVLMYFLCRWYGRYKFSHTQWWLKYI